MDDRTCENTLPNSEFYQKSSDLVEHTALTQVQLDVPVTYIGTSEGLIQQEIDNVMSIARMENYCRICGSEYDPVNLVYIFGDRGNELHLHKKLVNHLHLKVDKEDQLPQQVCNTCIFHLNISYQLFKISHSVDSKLRQLLLLPQISSNSDVYIIPELEALRQHEENPGSNAVAEEVPALESNILVNGAEHDSVDSNIDGDCEADKTTDETSKVDNKDEHTTSLLCHVCGKAFKHSKSLQAHKRTHLAESLKKAHHCSLCPKTFRSKFHLSEHMNIHNGVTPYSCSVCDKLFYKRAQLRQHAQIHVHDSKKVVCEVCGLRFSRRSNLQAHAKTHVKNRTFDCRLCHKKFPSFSEMLSHRKLHSQEDIKNRLSLDLVTYKDKIFTCEICDKVLTNKDSLISHLERHKPDGSGKFECVDCGKVLRSRRSLGYHQQSQHTGERPFHCSYCSEGFMTKKLQQAHERKHTGEKPFKCETCLKGFRSRNNLSQHMIKHTGEKNFECLICEKGFFRKSALTVHYRKHTGEKPFVCDLCGRSFGQKIDMLKHQKSHLEPNSRTHTCELCSSVFRSKKQLNKHKDSAHKQDENVGLVPLIITNNMFETHIITEDGQKIVITAVEAIDANSLVTPTSI